MVRVTCEHEASINHFSHPHPLQLSNFQAQLNLNQSTTCSACKLKLCDWVYSCTTCNFFLHAKCSKLPKQITHPYHKEHVLDLLAKPSYLSGSFVCDACGKSGDGFVYNCQCCERDLHILCSVLPMCRSHCSHPHELKLTFDIPCFSCDICMEMGQNQWLYWCPGCDFTVHLCCVNRSPVNQASRSVPQPQPFVGMNRGLENPAWNQGAQQGHFVAPNQLNQGLRSPSFNQVPQPGHFVAPNLLNHDLGYPVFNQVPQPGHYMQPRVAVMEEYQRIALQQAILQMRGAQNTMQNRVAIDMLQSFLNGAGNGIGSGLSESVMQGFGGGGGGGGLDMLQGLLGGGGNGIPGLDIGGIGDLLGGLGGLF